MGRSFAKWYDFFMNPLEKRKFKQIRNELLLKAAGNVLEIGSGTGVNFPFYQNADKVTAIEPSGDMIEHSLPRKMQAVVPIEVIQANAEKLPFEDNTFDTVVATLVFCTIPNPEQAIMEIQRVCKPGGKILLFEHVKMENPFLGGLQEMLTPAWKKICDGCCLNRDTIGLLKSEGITINKVQKYFGDLFLYIDAVNK
ncbi:class I SAM-dependent methyltransferase [Neobacillus mesonae]|uniref:class I SAM-dependent methyltransferase n=1 Tax=Neobacillus mesonae TaxID=1193713 RepID=UPI0020400664|nr:class I SAM-dependent methyltransferase [Neobacillus mesonae]MCM3567620.1 class I SAM-dependent methyltransferase [Neobacillus mesonae]